MIDNIITEESIKNIKNLRIYAENKIGEKYKLKFVIFYKNEAIDVKEYYYDKIYSLYANLFIFLQTKDLLIYESTEKLNDINQELNSKDDLFNVSISKYLVKSYSYDNKELDIYFCLNDTKCLIEKLDYLDERVGFKKFIEFSIKALKNIKINFDEKSIHSMLTQEDKDKRFLYRNINQMLKDKQNGINIYEKEYGVFIAGLSNFEYEYIYKEKHIKHYLNTHKQIIVRFPSKHQVYNEIHEEIKVYANKDNIDDIYELINVYTIGNRKMFESKKNIFILRDKKEKLLIIYLQNVSEDFIKNIKKAMKVVKNIRDNI